MNKKNIILALVSGFTFLHSTSAMVNHEEFEFDINSIVYIEDEIKIELGFDTADYLPENFDPYKSYFDLNSVIFLEEEYTQSKRMLRKLKRKLPKGFDAYADPKGIEGINYIDENDKIILDFDTIEYLPEGFNAYSR